MALLKEITYPNGITTKYHKITNVSNDNRVVITVKSYLDESHREKEISSLNRLSELTVLLSDSEIRTDKEIQELYSEQNEMFGSQDLSIKEQTFVLDELRDYTFEEAYDYLKTLPEFEGAQDI